MPGLRQVLGDRIRLARTRLSLSQEQVAKEAGFSAPQIISQIEKGERDVKAWEIVRLAEVLKTEVSYLLSADETRVTPFVLWRKSPERDKGILEAQFTRHCEQYALLEKLNDLAPSPELPKPRMNPSTMSFRDAGRFGEDVWHDLNLGTRPAGCLINVLEDTFQVKVWYEDLGEVGSAASSKGPYGNAILINNAEPSWRRNYSFGHELFHLITWDTIPPQTLIDNPKLWDKTEKLADVFASSLLLPFREINRAFESRIKDKKVTYTDLIEVAREFGVSTIALLWRLYNLGSLSKNPAALMDTPDFRALDQSYRKTERTMPLAIPERFVRLAFTAYMRGKLSRPRLAEYLNTSLIDLTDRLLEYGLDDHQNYQASVRASRRYDNY